MNEDLLVASIVLLTVAILIVLILTIVVLFFIKSVVKEAKEIIRKLHLEVERIEDITKKTGKLISAFRPSMLKFILTGLSGLLGVALKKKHKSNESHKKK